MTAQKNGNMRTKINRDTIIYGVVTAVAVFFIGWTTGMEGSWLPNLLFSILMGIFAAAMFVLVKKYGKSKE